MAFGIFKSGDELFDQGIDLIKRKEFAKARKVFEKTIEKRGNEAELSAIYIDLIDACLDNNNPSRFTTLADRLEKTNIGEFEFGLTEVDPKRLALECRLLAERVLIGRNSATTPQALEVKGNKFMESARKYQTMIGNDTIRISEIIGITVNTGIKEALFIQGWAYDNLAQAAVMTDPKKAAEMVQNAYNCRRQLGESGEREMALIRAYSKSVKCWICGRPSTGEGVHFYPMSSDITPFMRNTNDDVLQSAPESYSSVYVCRPCYTSISRKSDEIARGYHDQAMQEMRAMEARLRAEIQSVAAYSMVRR